jgi:hypothetical protein
MQSMSLYADTTVQSVVTFVHDQTSVMLAGKRKHTLLARIMTGLVIFAAWITQANDQL